MSRVLPADVVYFGKLPSRGDFVRNGDTSGLTQRLDAWLTQGVALLARDPRWKEVYDQARTASFAFLGVRSRAIVAGHLLASTDASGRRFPFVAVGKLEVEAPLHFMQRAPIALAPLWLQLGQAADRAHAADDAVPPLNQLSQLRPEVDVDPMAHEAGYRDFLALQTVGSLQSLLRAGDPATDLRRTLLALGLLLQPVPASGAQRLEKGVRLPLPADPLYQPYVATLWIDLAARFLARGDFEVAMFLPRGGAGGAPSLAIGFSGDSPALLHALLDPEAAAAHFVDLFAPDWVDDSAEQDYAVRKLGSYLQQPQLSLAQARSTFNEAFLGE
ncbi:type VI secretion system-associated protein TagF [Aquabacterium sp.]|uniref:type VI secretion system-associated protein TagF n=1 Tax=Aquabacterium sp. TaxID=1872578 RepID=UPI002B51A165|nr:type VI secretion system-associated protein TagF [Aquabacterium sp.]HSW04152.1 type VI secretion system-associated protein TagF [Aquabacterium sp.]